MRMSSSGLPALWSLAWLIVAACGPSSEAGDTASPLDGDGATDGHDTPQLPSLTPTTGAVGDTAGAHTSFDTGTPSHVMYGFSFVEPQLAGMPLPYGDDFAFRRLFFCAIWNDQTACGFLFALKTTNQHTIV